MVQQDTLTGGHRRSVASITVHTSVMVSGSNDGTVRLWTPNPQVGRWQMHGQAINNPSGAVNAVKVLGDALWVGGQTGITCVDLGTLQPRGTVQSVEPVTGLLEFQGHMIASYRNGDVKIFGSSGSEVFASPAKGEHQSNTAVELMMHPIDNKPMLLCGQQFGYVTAYDLPDFRPRGSFVGKNGSDVKSIIDLKAQGMFAVGGMHGDVTLWQWGQPGQPGFQGGQPGQPGFQGQQGAGGVPTSSSPFAPAGAAPAVSNPFAAAPGGMGMGMGAQPGMAMGCGGGFGGGMMG